MSSHAFSIRAVVYRVINELRLQDTSDYEYLEQIAFDGYRKMQLESMDSICVKYFDIPTTLQVPLPAGYVRYTKIGIVSNGRVLLLGHDMGMALPEGVQVCGKPIHEVDVLDDYQVTTQYGGMYFYPHHYNGTLQSALFGVGGGFKEEYYRIDTKNRQIIFSNEIPATQAVMEYIGTGDLCGDTIVPPHYVYPLMEYIFWRRIENDRRVSLGEKQRRKQEYLVALDDADRIQWEPTIDELMDAVYSGTHQGIKR